MGLMNVDQLMPGMVLEKNLLAFNGRFLLPRGAVLTNLAVQWSLLVLPYLLLPSLRPAARAFLSSLYVPASLRRCLDWLGSK